MRTWMCGGITAFFVLLSFQMACTSSGICQGGYSGGKLDPNGYRCEVDCDCNNQRFAGRCKDGACISQPRGTCDGKGRLEPCKLLFPPTTSCSDGVRICQDEGLVEGYWGDCKIASDAEATRAACADGLDNDCDGLVDKSDPDCAKFCNPGTTGSCYPGDEAKIGKGICKAGVRTCLPNGIWGDCLYAVVPEVEICNQTDDNCDGKVDEGDVCSCPEVGKERECYAGPEATRNRGICKLGKQTCEAKDSKQLWGACKNAVLPTPEVCNGQDDDCNGLIDDVEGGCGCIPGETRYCYSGPPDKLRGICHYGLQTCEEGPNKQGLWGKECKGEKLPEKEICNGLDDDCNGKTDDDPACECWPPQRNEPCYSPTDKKTLNRGVCVSGLRTCGVDGKWSACLGEITPQVEDCDNKDNDCDGQVDEDIQPRACYDYQDGGCTRNPDGRTMTCKPGCVAGTQGCGGTGVWDPSCVGQKACGTP